jgi:hypothetical protein
LGGPAGFAVLCTSVTAVSGWPPSPLPPRPLQAAIVSYLPTPGLVKVAFTSRDGRRAVEQAFETQFALITGVGAPKHWSLLAQFKFLERLHKRYDADNLLYLITWCTTDTGAWWVGEAAPAVGRWGLAPIRG